MTRDDSKFHHIFALNIRSHQSSLSFLKTDLEVEIVFIVCLQNIIKYASYTIFVLFNYHTI